MRVARAPVEVVEGEYAPLIEVCAVADDDLLGGTFTFAAGADISWSLYATDETVATLDGINVPVLPPMRANLTRFAMASEPGDVDRSTPARRSRATCLVGVDVQRRRTRFRAVDSVDQSS